LYTKEEASLVREKFWKSFGQYMSYVPAADGRTRINWINYKTGYKYIHFKTNADKRAAAISLVFNHPDESVQELMFEQLKSLSNMLPEAMNSDWEWELLKPNAYYKTESSVTLRIDNVNIFDEKSWPTLISFFKTNFIMLDETWSEIQFAFEEYQYL